MRGGRNRAMCAIASFEIPVRGGIDNDGRLRDLTWSDRCDEGLDASPDGGDAASKWFGIARQVGPGDGVTFDRRH